MSLRCEQSEDRNPELNRERRLFGGMESLLALALLLCEMIFYYVP